MELFFTVLDFYTYTILHDNIAEFGFFAHFRRPLSLVEMYQDWDPAAIMYAYMLGRFFSCRR